MSKLPAGWSQATLGTLMKAEYGKGLTKGARVASGKVPVYGSAGITGYHDEALISEPAVVVGRKGNAGAIHFSPGPSWPIDTTYFLRPPEGLDIRFLALFLRTAELSALDSSTALPSLRRHDLEGQIIPIPPAAEQQRIVTVIEEQFSRLDAADGALRAAIRRVSALRKSILVSFIPEPLPRHWNRLRVEDVGDVQLGRQRSPKNHQGPNMRPYLRVANVFEDRLDLTDVMQMNFSDQEVERYRLHAGDILLNEGQSPHLVGRPAMFRGELPEDVCFTNSLIRFKPRPGVDGEFALLVFRSHLHSGRFQREARITTNIAHMAAGRFKTVEFPVPPAGEQRARVAETHRALSILDALDGDIGAAVTRSRVLRRSILERAFSGELVPQDPADESASFLLDRSAEDRNRRQQT